MLSPKDFSRTFPYKIQEAIDLIVARKGSEEARPGWNTGAEVLLDQGIREEDIIDILFSFAKV